MRNALLVAGALVALSASFAAPAFACDGEKAEGHTAAKASDNANLASASFTVDGMSCAVSCPVAIKTALTGLSGVSDVTVNFDTKKVEVHYTASEVTPEQMVEAITKLGYKAEAIKAAGAEKADS